MKAIVGLGNPEKQYAANRHNIGFLIVDRIAAGVGVDIKAVSQRSRYCRLQLWGADTLLIKPQTFMNRSGVAVCEALDRWEIPLPDLLVVYDDFALPLGRIRLRPGGSAAGHNGMASVIAETGTDRIPRLRFGIGGPCPRHAAGFVLSDFSRAELPVVEREVDRAIEAIRCLWHNGIMKAMSLFNRDPKESGSDLK